MQLLFNFKLLALGLSIILPMKALHAGIPVWTFEPLTATTVAVPGDGTTTIQYRVTNQSKKSHTLVMTPITGITQVTTAGNCPNPFVLTYQQSCILTLQITGSSLKGPVTRGPVVCQKNSQLQCYQPSLANSLNISIIPVPPQSALVAAGTLTNGATIYPLLAQSVDNGSTWSYRINNSTPSLPSDYSSNGYLLSSSCNATTCIAAGRYTTTSNFSYPLVAQSTNNQTSWSYVVDSSTPGQPSPFNTGDLSGASCNAGICIAVGNYSDGSATTPLLIQNTTNNSSWNYKIYNNAPLITPPPGLDSGIFNSASCSPGLCIAAGSYSIILDTFPLLASTTDNGVSWFYRIDNTTPALPPDYTSFGSFSSASCHAGTCIAAGWYVNNISQVPLLAQSANGTTWSYRIDSGSPNLPADFVSSATFSSASCYAGTCIAVGSYFNGALVPLLAQSTDNGVTWNYRIDSGITPGTPNLPADFQYDGEFKGGSCGAGICIAAGSYIATNNNTYPLLAQSTDNGTTWSYSIDSSNAPPGNLLGKFNAASCNTNVCIAVGTYSVDGIDSYPLLAQSTDRGTTWSYTINNNTPALPPGSTGMFYTGNAGTLSFLPEALKFIYLGH